MATVPLLLPRLGETMEEGRVGRWLKRPGEAFRRGEVLLEVESDKTTVELPALADGRLVAILVQDGEEARVGAPIATIETGAAVEAGAALAPGPTRAEIAPPGTPATPAPAAPALQPFAAPAPPLDGRAQRRRATPSARRLAAEVGVSLLEVTGTGRRGRVEQGDVRDHAARRQAGAAAPAGGGRDFARFGPVRRERLSRVRRLSGANLARSWVTIPHVTQHDEADITELESFRSALNAGQPEGQPKVTLLAFLVKACAAALQQFPEVNASLEGDELVLKGYYHLGFAADTPHGLVVPVLRDADRKSLRELAGELSALAARARLGKLSPDDVQGGTFSVSSLGGIGGTSFTPIINAPEVAILGVSRSARKPVWIEGGFVPRLMLPLSLAYDHRVVDGAQAARFTTHLARLLLDFRQLVG
jgi:pyruvate dehydrogenase E2 component (dihydrolipoamide acetyltransferase)